MMKLLLILLILKLYARVNIFKSCVCFDNLQKNQRNKTKIFSRKGNSILKDSKL